MRGEEVTDPAFLADEWEEDTGPVFLTDARGGKLQTPPRPTGTPPLEGRGVAGALRFLSQQIVKCPNGIKIATYPNGMYFLPC